MPIRHTAMEVMYHLLHRQTEKATFEGKDIGVYIDNTYKGYSNGNYDMKAGETMYLGYRKRNFVSTKYYIHTN